MEIRCGNKMHGILTSEGVMEIKCSSSFCGSEPGVVVIHRFSVATGELIETKLFKDTPKIRKGNRDGDISTSLRSA